jgi:hypothetical protein
VLPEKRQCRISWLEVTHLLKGKGVEIVRADLGEGGFQQMTDMVASIETIENRPDNHSRGRQDGYSVWPGPPLAS